MSKQKCFAIVYRPLESSVFVFYESNEIVFNNQPLSSPQTVHLILQTRSPTHQHFNLRQDPLFLFVDMCRCYQDGFYDCLQEALDHHTMIAHF